MEISNHFGAFVFLVDLRKVVIVKILIGAQAAPGLPGTGKAFSALQTWRLQHAELCGELC